MSLLLSQARKPKEQSLLKKLFSTYQQETTNSQQQADKPIPIRRLRTLYVFTSDSRKAFTESQRAFLLNFFIYLAKTNSKKPDAELQASINKLLDPSGDSSL